MERQALEALLDPPVMLEPQSWEHTQQLEDIDRALLSAHEIEAISSLQQGPSSMMDMTGRLQRVISNLQPAVDTFADGVHRLVQYQNRADRVASQVLSLCADRLAERERVGRRKALGTDGDGDGDGSPGRDLNNVLRGLSRAGR